MSFVVDPRTAVTHRFAFELRFERGELYWDRCGRVARKLASREGWEIQSVDITGCHIRHEEQNLYFAFSSTKLDLGQAQNKEVLTLATPGEFGAVAEEFSAAVVEALELDVYPRIGFRVWTMYPTESVDDASSRLSKMSFFASRDVLTGLGPLSYVSHNVVIERPDHMVRVAVTPFEQQIALAPSVVAAARVRARDQWANQKTAIRQKLKAKKIIDAFPPHGLLIDLDAYIEEPPFPKQLPVATFIKKAVLDFDAIRTAILAEDNQE